MLPMLAVTKSNAAAAAGGDGGEGNDEIKREREREKVMLAFLRRVALCIKECCERRPISTFSANDGPRETLPGSEQERMMNERWAPLGGLRGL
eukprot:s1155_g5.t1